MKKITLATSAIALLLLGSSCSSKEVANESNAAALAEKKTAKVEGDTFEPTTNIRYYNMDSESAVKRLSLRSFIQRRHGRA